MQKLSKSRASKKHLDSISGIKSKPVSKKVQNKLEEASLAANEKIRFNNSVYNQSNSHSNEAITYEKKPAERFIDNIDNMRNPHIRDCVSLSEKYGTIEDYSKYQEQRDLENYKNFINSSAYDDIKESESEIEKQLTLTKLRKIGAMHDD